MKEEQLIEAGSARQAVRADVLVLGVGNILLEDDGLGVRVVEAMRDVALPEGVELFDGATAGADLMDVIADRRKVVVIDAVQADVAPGTVLRFTGNDFARRQGLTLSLHQVGFIEAVTMAGHIGAAPREVVVIGVRPAKVDFGLDLSEEVRAAIPRVIRLVLSEIEKPPAQ